MEKKTTTYGELKHRKAELRNNDLVVVNMEEYLQTIRAIKDAELTLLWNITPEESCGELPEQPKENKRARIAQIVVVIVCVVAILVIAFGCQTFKGATGDSAWMLQKLSDNIKVQEK